MGRALDDLIDLLDFEISEITKKTVIFEPAKRSWKFA